MSKRSLVGVIAFVLTFLVGAVLGYSLGHAASTGMPSAQAFRDAPFQEAHTASYQPQQRDSINDAIGNSRRNAITRTVAQASPAVVGINVIEVRQYRAWTPWGDDPFFRQFFGDRVYSQRVQELGSGFIISADGYIVTNDHVAGNAKEIAVTLTSGEKYTAELVGTDQVTDIALLKIKGDNLPSLRLGNSDEVITGEWVIALGNPFGLFDISDKPTVTVGVVSATGMNLRSQDNRVYRGMIQTDAAINSGNSGGPLVNSLGEVIGVNAVIFTPNQGNIGLGFAIHINRVKTVLAELKRSGKIDRQYWTGLEVQPVDARVARYFGLDKVQGVIISDVSGESPAARAGFKPGDIILEVNGEAIPDESTLVSIVDDARVGDVLRVKVLRERKEITLNLTLERRST